MLRIKLFKLLLIPILMKKLFLAVVMISMISLVTAMPSVQLNTTTNYTTSSDFPVVEMFSNASIQNVNSSDFWDNLDTPNDISIFWKNDGTSTATDHWDIGNFDFYAGNMYGSAFRIDSATLSHFIGNSADSLQITNANSGKNITLTTNNGVVDLDSEVWTEELTVTEGASIEENLNVTGNITGDGSVDFVLNDTEVLQVGELGIGVRDDASATSLIEASPNVGGIGNSFVGIRLQPSLTAATNGIYYALYYLVGVGGSSNYNSLIGGLAFPSQQSSGKATEVIGFQSKLSQVRGTTGTWSAYEANSGQVNGIVEKAYGLNIKSVVAAEEFSTSQGYGIMIDGVEAGSIIGGNTATSIWLEDVSAENKYGIVIDVDGSGDGAIYWGEGQDVWMYWDGSNFIINQSGNGAYTFYNSSGLGKLRAKEYATSTPFDLAYNSSNKYIDTLPNTTNLLDADGKIKRGAFRNAHSQVEVRDGDNCWNVTNKYCFNETDDKWGGTKEVCVREIEKIPKGVTYWEKYRQECGTKMENVTLIGTQAFENTIMVSELKAELDRRDSCWDRRTFTEVKSCIQGMGVAQL